ncbi:TP53-binding protein 1 [Frankliniella fusca]|uniref:TP53-binding protein 1 n=1 Tax=Frankliniella fusca TaxID=407009 RepID=A0AAE1H839_9NEOP|nr:TP53-binding protein 1 [Frankliniella fusca]
MSLNGNSHISNDDEETVLLSQDFSIVYTGQSCSGLEGNKVLSEGTAQLSEDEETEAISSVEDVILTGQTCSQTDDVAASQDLESENTEPVSQDTNVVYTGQSCSSQGDDNSTQQKDTIKAGRERLCAEEPFDPDTTYVDESLLLAKNVKVVQESSRARQASGIDKHAELEKPYLTSSSSEELTQPLQHPESNFSLDSTQPVSEDNTLSPTSVSEAVEQKDLLSSLSRTDTAEVKPSKSCQGPFHDDRSSLPTSSSGSSSQIISSSSSSKRPTDSDDTDDMAGSQDMFASQGSSQTSQRSVLTTSQFLPTLQLSADIPFSQGYEGFVPDSLPLNSPTCQSTSTPLSKVNKLQANNLSGDVIAFSDEDVPKVNEKRKHSDSSDDSRSMNINFKRPCVDNNHDNRQSVVFVKEITSPQRQMSSSSPDLSYGSQGFNLYMSQLDTDETGSQNTISPSSSSISAKPQTDSQAVDTPNINNSTTSHNISVVNLDDMDDEVQLVSSPVTKSNSVGEIQIMDSSETHQGLSTSGDIQVITPVKKINLSHSSQSPAKISEKSYISNRSSSSSKTVQPVYVTLAAESPDKVSDDAMKNACQSENNIQEFSNKIFMTFTCTYSVSCHTTIDMTTKKTLSNSISSFDVIESKTVEKRDSSPSAVEESSPGKGGGSPGSVASGPGPFRLQPSHAARFSMISTTSSSSAGSCNYHEALARRGRAAVSQWKGSEAAPKGPVPWRDLLHQCQDELANSGAPFLEKWGVSPILNSSSEEGKAVHEEKGLETVPENDGEEVLGVPDGSTLKMLSSSKRPLRNVSSSTAVQKDPENATVLKTECETPTSKRKRGRPPKSATPSRTPSESAKKRGATPKTKGLDETSSIPEDSSLSSGSSYFTPGTFVFALWKGSFYPGHIESVARANHWNISFVDGVKSVVNKSDIMIINTFEIDQSVLVKDKTGFYHHGKISNVTPLKGGEDLFTVELSLPSDSLDSMTVPISDLALNENQAKLFANARPPSAQSSSSPSKPMSASKMSSSDHEILKNLDILHDLPGRRARTPRSGHSTLSSPGRPGPSNTSRRLIVDGYGSSTAEDEPLATLLAKEKVGPYAQVVGVEPEQMGFASADPLARKGKGVKNNSLKRPLPDIDNDEIVKQLGPIPPDGSKIFAGYTFLLTKTDVEPKDRREPVTDSEVTATDGEDQHGGDVNYPSDSECYKFTRCPMVKDRLARQITQGGGKVIKHWTDIMTKDINSTYVVSNRPCLTPIYLHCIVRGVKGINHDYIIDCCRQNTKFSSNYKQNLLPVGYSHIKQEFVVWREHKSKAPLTGEHILVVGDEDKLFKAFWEDLLKHTGAKPSSAKTSRGMTTVTKVISDNPCSETILRRAEELNIPVLSPVWITQSLIENTNLSCAKLPSFAYDYVESE